MQRKKLQEESKGGSNNRNMGRFQAALIDSQKNQKEQQIIIEGDPAELNKAASFIQNRFRNK